MGCEASQPIIEEGFDLKQYITSNTYAERKNNFDERHRIFTTSVLSGEFASEMPYFENLQPNEVKGNLSILYKKYNKQLEDIGMKEVLFNVLMYEIYAEHIIKGKMRKVNYDIFNLIEEMVLKLNICEIDEPKYKNIQYLFQKEFETQMNYVVFSDKILKDTTLAIKLGIIRQMKFTPEYQPNIFTLYLNDDILNKDELIDSLCDMLLFCPSIRIVNIILYPIDIDGNIVDKYGLSCNSYQSLYKLMDAIGKNRKIKSLFIHSQKDYSITLAPEIFNKILVKLQSETLVAFHFGNFSLSDGLKKKLFFQLSNTRILRFLSLHLNNIEENVMNDIFDTIKENLSLVAFCLTNIENEREQKKFYNKINQFLLNEKETKEKAVERGLQAKTSGIEYFFIGDKSIVNVLTDEGNKHKQSIDKYSIK